MNDGLSDEQREQLRTQFREGMGSIPEDTPELRERFAHIREVLALADALHARHESWPADMAVNEYEAPYIAQAVLASQWLADRDARIRDDERARMAEDAVFAAPTSFRNLPVTHPAPTPGWICDTCGCWNRITDPCKFDGDMAHLADRDDDD